MDDTADDDVTALEPGVRVVSVRMTLDGKGNLERIARALEARPEVERVDWSEGSLVGAGTGQAIAGLTDRLSPERR